LPTTQKPVSATVTDAAAVTITATTASGCHHAASAVATSSTTPATSQTVRSMYQRSVGTMYQRLRADMGFPPALQS